MTKTIQQAVNQLAMHTEPIGSRIELHRPTGFYTIEKTTDGIYSQCRGNGKLHPRQKETPQYQRVGK